jgi:hypothetical protein
MPRQLLLLFGLFCTLNACKEKLAEPDFVYTGAPEFALDLFEQRSAADGASSLGLWVSSFALQDGAGFGINADVEIKGQDVVMHILGVQKPNAVTGQPAPATGFVPFGSIAEGNYKLTVILGATVQSHADLAISKDHFELSNTDARGIVFQNMTLRHLPDGLVWGYADAHNEVVKAKAEQFVSDLKNLSSEAGLAPGFYSYFTVTGTGTLFLHPSIDPADAHIPFVRALSGTPDALRGLLEGYRTNGQLPLKVKCLSGWGEL